MMKGKEKLSLDPRIAEFFERDSIAYLSLRIPAQVGEWLKVVAASQFRSVNNLILNHLCKMLIDDKPYQKYMEQLKVA